MKWFAVMMGIYFLALFGGMAVSDYSKSQCKTAFAQSSKTVQEINQLCK